MVEVAVLTNCSSAWTGQVFHISFNLPVVHVILLEPWYFLEEDYLWKRAFSVYSFRNINPRERIEDNMTKSWDEVAPFSTFYLVSIYLLPLQFVSILTFQNRW